METSARSRRFAKRHRGSRHFILIISIKFNQVYVGTGLGTVFTLELPPIAPNEPPNDVGIMRNW